MKIDYNHSSNLHTQDGPRAVMPRIIAEVHPKSLLDVGCGTGTWLKAAADLGVADFFGVDGVAIAASRLLIPSGRFAQQDLTKTWDLGRRFDVALCLEVAEHLDESHAGNLIDSLVRHADLIFFSAACPGQEGQHHVNCQWPDYWQRLFNERGFACSDDLRWQIWDDSHVEPWYKQNMFKARRAPELAGQEPRIKSFVHPDMWSNVTPTSRDFLSQIEQGSLPPLWYATVAPRAYLAKLKRRFKTS
jgi:SAM-dependent methyltransferase